MAHLRGIPTYLRERFDLPIVFYDGDVPMSLPEFGGMDTGFNYYHEADPGEYDLVVSNSEGGLERLRELGARRAEAVFWGADPDFFAPQRRSRRRWTSSSTATATSSGASGCRRSSASPRARCPTSTSRSAAATSTATSDARARIGDVPFNAFARAISAARVNLCITRRSHATVYASSSCRPFELASAGAAIVANPYNGIERWFEPGSELIVVERRRRGDRRLPRSARRPGAGRGDGPPRARARARRAHLPSSRAPAARAGRPRSVPA